MRLLTPLILFLFLFCSAAFSQSPPGKQLAAGIDSSLMPLYKTLIENGHSTERSIMIAQQLFPIYQELGFNGDDGPLIEQLHVYRGVLNQFIVDNGLLNKNILILTSLVGGDSEKDFSSVLDTMAANPKLQSSLLDAYSCEFHTYLTNVLLKSKGIKVDMIDTKNINWLFSDFVSWQDKILMVLGLKAKILNQNHVCNIIWVDNDKFVIVDSTNPYVSPVYSWKSDLIHIGDNYHSFISSDVYIKYFQLRDPKYLRGELLIHFSELFSGELQRKYILQAAELEPDELNKIWGLIAESYFEDHHLDEAENWAQKVILSDENNAHANLVLGRIYMDRGNYDQALRYAQTAASSNPEDGMPDLLLGLIYNEGYHDGDKSKGYIQKAIKIDESNNDAYDARIAEQLLQKVQ